MSVIIPGVFVTTFFLLTAWTIFGGLLDTTNDQTDSLKDANELHEERLDTLISINCASDSTSDTFTSDILNSSKGVSFGDFSEVDVSVRYENATGDTVVKRLTNPSEWTISSISGDATDILWEPGEEATISFTLTPSRKAGTKGRLSMAVPGGVNDSIYFPSFLNSPC